ncbi:hypothetical protein BJ742DRAFT_737742 [Cladochytrium replicatum]|nr:hypothetical protein BJ742DRAFT_737742 [Cladochytrium replicatum]
MGDKYFQSQVHELAREPRSTKMLETTHDISISYSNCGPAKGVVKGKQMRFDADCELAEEDEIEYNLAEGRKERRRRHRELRENDSSNSGQVDECEGGKLDGEDELGDGNKETNMPGVWCWNYGHI